MKRALLIFLAVATLMVGGRLIFFFSAHAQAGPTASLNGDVNGDGDRDISDALYLINWLFLGGDEPVAIADSGLSERVQSLEEQMAALAAEGASPEAQMKKALDALKPLSTGDEGTWEFPLQTLKPAEDAAGGAPAAASLFIDRAPVGTVLAFKLTEEVSQPPRLDVIAVVPLPAFTPARLGAPIKLVYQDAGGQLLFNGEVGEASLAGVDDRNAYVRIRCFSKLHRLTRGRKSQIFQDKSVPDIARQIFAGAGITDADYEFILERQYPPRDYCVQYQESDFDFVSRLMEEEGIYYFSIDSDEAGRIRFGDGRQGRIPPTGSSLRYPGYGIQPPAGSGPYISALHRAVAPAVGHVSVGDYDVLRASPVFGQAGAAGSGEDFEFGVNLFDPPSLNELAQRKLELAQVSTDVLRGASGNPTLKPGIVVSISGTDARFNGKYYVVGCTHRYVHSGSGKGGSSFYGNTFECIPEAAQHRPPCVKKPVAPGGQTAIVTGPAGQRIYTDSLGRVKVKFPWLPNGSADENSSAWIRVAQNHTTGAPGFFLPEVEDEVLVLFEHGDINRPIVIGSLWNGKDKPPN